MATTMVPDPELLTEPHGDAVLPNGRPAPALREDLRRIPSLRNAVSVASVFVQTIGIVWLAIRLDNPFAWVAAFLLMGRANAQLAALMHEAAHRLLFRNRRVNDWVGRWLLGFPQFTPIDLYRRGHMNHHRDEFGPNEPDIPLYRGYPISRDSLRRKLVRDATGQTGFKLLKGLLRGAVSKDAAVRGQARRIVGVQLVLLAATIALGHPWLYLFLWLLPHLTVWRVINRLRSIAEHGGMERSSDRRNTTHSVHQSPLARFALVPYCIGWHLAHHVDSGIPMHNLPRYHRTLIDSGYVTDGLEYRSYRALWRRLSSRPVPAAAAR
ncbi:MAG TPA: fatty acid desaturase family protein [Acidimicrobiia bacterium]|nr:fatty acid desaturase family protein [Acidimicrobiia bacterium]